MAEVSKPYYAHSAARPEHFELLRVHLRLVADRASRYASAWGGESEAHAAGLLHDLGKYTESFQRRLLGLERGLDHWTIGAVAAGQLYRDDFWAVALAIHGHHVGLQRGSRRGLGESLNIKQLEKAALAGTVPRLTSADSATLLSRLRADGLEPPDAIQPFARLDKDAVSWMLAVRFLFSALVDADHIETAAHFDGELRGIRDPRPEPPELQPRKALGLLEARVAKLRSDSEADPDASADLQQLRTQLFEACRDGGTEPTGLFTLTAPTGSGKTLAMLEFAMRHAAEHGLRRVVVALPFLSILDQTAKTCRDLFDAPFGKDYVLEHHSLADAGEGTAPGEAQSEAASRRRAMVESWDSPVVVTTHVQLLESLFANRPMRCRKLHNLARSVILLDEVQTLPVGLAVPTLAALSALARQFGSTIVFATATQPAFDALDGKVRELTADGWRPKELVPKRLELARRLDRVEIRFELDVPVSWTELSRRIAQEPQVLVVVNLKRHARLLAEELAAEVGKEGLFLLSTSLCPAHRREVLEKIAYRLRHRLPCRLVATQCIEAGVDLDFPAGFRALGPLDSIVQVAGRVNRNGRFGRSALVVFLPEEEKYPGGLYQNAAKITRMCLRDAGRSHLDLADEEFFLGYFRKLYDLTSGVDQWQARNRAGESLKEALTDLDFRAVAACYQLIDQDAVEVLVPYDKKAFDELRAEVEERGYPTRDWIRRARPHAVSVYRSDLAKPEIGHVLEPILVHGRDGERESGWYVCLDEASYDDELAGLKGTGDPWNV